MDLNNLNLRLPYHRMGLQLLTLAVMFQACISSHVPFTDPFQTAEVWSIQMGGMALGNFGQQAISSPCHPTASWCLFMYVQGEAKP